jgi:hypothetical protein
MKKFPYRNWEVYLSWNRYTNKRLRLTLLDAEDGCHVAIATVNIPEEDLAPNEIIVNNYSENEGMLEFLQKNDIVGSVKRFASQGYVSCPVVELSETFLNSGKLS